MSKTSQRKVTFQSLGYKHGLNKTECPLRKDHPNYKDYISGKRKALEYIKQIKEAVPIDGYVDLDTPPISLNEALENLNRATHTVMKDVITTLNPEQLDKFTEEPKPLLLESSNLTESETNASWVDLTATHDISPLSNK